ncbi:MAG: SufD family Fe-S cluster assembly protein [bacterium]
MDHNKKTITIPAYSHITFHDDLKNTHETITFIIHKDGSLDYVIKNITQSAPNISRTITTILAEQGASATIKGFFYGEMNNSLTINTIQKHCAPNTSSSVMIKGVLDNQSQLRCKSIIRVEKEAYAIQATQINKTIMLSPDARAFTAPILEILNKDVICQHGAAISKLDNNHLFYLQSKGFSQTQARDILIGSFLNS